MALDLQGHRGARGLKPENTLAAFATALSIGVSTLEMDVGVTRDGVVVVMHDRALNPVIARDPQGGWLSEPGPAINTLSYAQLARYDVGKIKPGSDYASNFPEQRAVDGARIPTLEEVVALIRKAGSRVRLNVEAKLSPEEPHATLPPEAFADAIVSTLRRTGFERRATVQSFEWRVLQRVQAIAPEIPTSYLSSGQSWLNNLDPGEPGSSAWRAGYDVDDYAGSVPRLIEAAGGSAWSPYYRELEASALEEAHELGLKVFVWTVNSEPAMREMIAIGVDGIITDYPDRLREVMAELGLALPQATPVEP